MDPRMYIRHTTTFHRQHFRRMALFYFHYGGYIVFFGLQNSIILLSRRDNIAKSHAIVRFDGTWRRTADRNVFTRPDGFYSRRPQKVGNKNLNTQGDKNKNKSNTSILFSSRAARLNRWFPQLMRFPRAYQHYSGEQNDVMSLNYTRALHVRK